MPEEVPAGEITIPHLAPTQRLVSLPPMHLRDARSGAGPSLSTALRLGWRGDRLLVRFDCRHRGTVATLREDNGELWREDVVEAFLSLGDPPIRYLELEVNPLGAKFSAIVDSPHLSREGMTVRTFPFPEFTAEATVRETRWSARLSIPFRGMFEVLATPAVLRGAAGCFAPEDVPAANVQPRGGIPSISPLHLERGGVSRGEVESFRANFFRIDRTSGELSALFPTLADPPDFHVPERFGRFRLKA